MADETNKVLAPPTTSESPASAGKVAQPVAPARYNYPGRRTLILIVAGLVTGLLLAAMDQTIVATAAPTIIAKIGGLSEYTWVFSAYILTQTVSMPVFGKLSDLYGRKRMFMLGLVVFMVGSALSGQSRSIGELIVFRAMQGVGSGAAFPVAIAVAGMAFPPNQRGRVQGIFSSVFGIAAVIGPSLGSYLVTALSWQWIFYINLPLGVASLFLINLGLKESRALNARSVIDWLGISTLTGWILLLMLGFLNGGTSFSWFSWQEVALFGGAGILFPVFLLIERRAKEPVIPLPLFKKRTVSSAAATAFLRGMPFYAVITFVPLFVQGALGGSVNDERNVLYAFMFPMIAGTLIGGQIALRTGYRKVVAAGIALMTTGIYLMTSLSTSTPLVAISEYVAIMGLGVGITFPIIVLAMQFSVERRQIGVASSLAQFMGNLGGSIGLSILGTIQNNAFSTQLSNVLRSVPPTVQSQAAPFLGNPNLIGQLLTDPTQIAGLVARYPQMQLLLPELRLGLAHSMTPLFWAAFFISVVALVTSLFIKGSFKQQLAEREVAEASTRAKEEASTNEEEERREELTADSSSPVAGFAG